MKPNLFDADFGGGLGFRASSSCGANIGYFTTERHEELRNAVREFAESEVRPAVARMERVKDVEQDVARLIAAQGWIGVTVGCEYGGMDLGHLAKTIIIEEISRVSGAMGAMTQASQLGVAKIIHFGNEKQKRKWLPRIASGDCLPTIAVTEHECGGHILGMTAHAERDGDEYILNGRKCYVGNSHVGDLHGVVVRTSAGSKGLSAFLVESDKPGVRCGEHRPAMGLHGFSFGELIFENCRVPAENLLGEEGDGLAVSYSSSMVYGKANLTAVALGIHRAILDETVAFTKERRRYDAPLCELPTIRQKTGQMQSRFMTAKLAAYHAAHLLDLGLPCDAELMNAKLINVEYGLDSARAAMEIHAACGLFADRPIERFLRDAHHLNAPAGTSDVQALRLAEIALGTNKGQWSGSVGRRSERVSRQSSAVGKRRNGFERETAHGRDRLPELAT
jgi:alkylation response protein AidB-like acyl-CoA dehydrogenase